jgi:hypothetical protein
MSKLSGANEPLVLNYAAPIREARPWPVGMCGLFLFMALLLQALFLPCLCGDSIVKEKFALYVDVLFVLRVALARVIGQRNRDWLIYVMIVLTSAAWIEYVLGAAWIRAAYAFVGIAP